MSALATLVSVGEARELEPAQAIAANKVAHEQDA